MYMVIITRDQCFLKDTEQAFIVRINFIKYINRKLVKWKKNFMTKFHINKLNSKQLHVNYIVYEIMCCPIVSGKKFNSFCRERGFKVKNMIRQLHSLCEDKWSGAFMATNCVRNDRLKHARGVTAALLLHHFPHWNALWLFSIEKNVYTTNANWYTLTSLQPLILPWSKIRFWTTQQTYTVLQRRMSQKGWKK